MKIFNEILLLLFEAFLFVVITVGLPVAFKYIKESANKFIDDKKINTKNALVQVALADVKEAVVNAVNFVNQKYVCRLKEENRFTYEVQHEALRTAIKSAKDLIPQADKDILKDQGVSIDKMLEIEIEAHINQLVVDTFERNL